MNKNIIIAIIIVLLVIVATALVVRATNQDNNEPTTNPMTNGLKNSSDIEKNPTTFPETNQETKTVSIKDFAFSVADLTISKGETVIWLNEDSVVHTVKFTDLESEDLSQDETFQRLFNQTGAFNYHCGLHPNMIAKIIVE